MSLTAQGAVMALRKIDRAPALATKKGAGRAAKGGSITTASVWMKLAGARPDMQIEGVDPLPGRVNYFIGNDSTHWHRDIPTYARVKHRSVYPGIDLVYHGTPEALEYDLIVAPGADPGAIRIELLGAKTRLDARGNLVIGTAAGISPRASRGSTRTTRRGRAARSRAATRWRRPGMAPGGWWRCRSRLITPICRWSSTPRLSIRLIWAAMATAAA